MNPADPPVVDSSSDELIEARIDALDERFADPLREFLQAHGIRVFVNRPTGVSATYHLAVGDMAFVKDIFDTEKEEIKQLAVVWGNGEHDVTLPARVKCVLVDPKILAIEVVEEIFSFLFTSQATVLDMRKHSARDSRNQSFSDSGNREEPVIVEEIKTEPAADVLEASDTQRIGSIIADIFDTKKEQRGESNKERRGDSTKRGRPRKARPTWAGFVAGCLAIGLSPLIWFVISLGVAAGSLGLSGQLLREGDGRSIYAAQAGSYWVRQASLAWKISSAPLRLVGLGRPARHGERLVSFLSDVARAEIGAHEMIRDAQAVGVALFGAEAGERSAIALVEKLRLSAAAVHNSVGLAEAQLTTMLSDGAFLFGIPAVVRAGKRGVVALAKFRDTSSFLEQFLALYPTIGGFSGKQTYLVLLQNSMELRPTGGFIGSIAVVSVENGAVLDVSVSDVYALDGQLKGHVPPPTPIRDLLHQEHWYLRDSNWNPDFAKSGERAAWFYQKEAGTAVDGVIAVSLPFIVELLKATGPLELSDYPDRITAENFFGKALFYTQTEFFPGSTQKKDFLGSAATTLLLKLSESRGVSPTGVFRAIAGGLDNRDLQLYFAASDVQNLVDHFGWTGRVWGREGCVGADVHSCLFDPVFAAEANLSVNKANAFIGRERVRQVVFDESGTIRESLIFSYRNPSSGPPKDAGGAYRGYVQIVLPSDAKEVTITVNGEGVPRREAGIAAPTVPFWEWSAEGDISVVGLAFDVPAGGMSSVGVSYGREARMVFGSTGAVFEAYDQKQAGIADASWQLSLRYPIFWEASEEQGNLPAGNQAFLAKEAQLEYNTTIPGDHLVRVRFKK
ncbi:MAG: hypothetical protein UY27_C0013G0008 [Candidatus Gottesmanbacteria bacterium GW2011_GWA1_48_13]|uniref:DUF4012 domain-containing protein n=1 Tax=Candidatus Gottesmanbacteria bacterium GW2011_GWA1_48_13 TaxID=1618439 RepID=A0A0G1UND4_9BACT|nr:MAG: hypothetical protein UY27_C0013G0008 [Candidatus Gottesmanbacteria bacterium GW2011_GWA1_48_13]